MVTMRSFWLMALISAGILLQGEQVLAGGFTIIELGGKKTGMMCSVAKPDDLSGVYHNPAGIADLHGTRLHLSAGFSFLDITARVQTWEGGEGYLGSDLILPDVPVDDEGYFAEDIKPTRYFGVMPMFVSSTDFGIADGPVIALSVYVPDFIGAFLPEDAPTRYMVTEAYLIVGMVSLTAAYRLPDPVDWLAFGASIGVMYTRLDGKRWHNQPTIGDMSADYILSLKGEDYQTLWNVGLMVNPIPELTIGLSWIGGVDVALKGDLDISLPPGVEEEDPLINALGGLTGRYEQTTHMVVPSGLGAGVNWTVIPELDLAVDFRYWFYRAFKEQTMDHSIDLELMGSPAVDNPLVTPKDFNDSWTISLGALTRPFPAWLPLELMVGWTYDESPAPSRTKSLDTPTTDLTGFSLGARYTFDQTWRLTMTYYHYWYLKDEVTDSILVPPQNASFWGQVDTVSLQLEVTL